MSEKQLRKLEKRVEELRSGRDGNRDSALAIALCKLAGQYFHRDLGNAMDCSVEAMEMADGCGFREESAKSRRMIGTIHWARGEFGPALDYIGRAMEMYRETGDEKGVASCMNNLGLVYEKQGEYKKALEKHLEALAIRERIGDRKEQALSLTNIGNLCHWTEHHLEALEYYRRVLDINLQLDDPIGIADSRANIGMVRAAQDRYEEALGFYYEALEGYEKLGHTTGIADVCNNIGICLNFMDMSDRALEYHQRALSCYIKRGDPAGRARSQLNISFIHLKRNRLDLASTLLAECFENARQSGDRFVIMNVLEGMSTLFEKKGDFKLALQYQKKFLELRDRIVRGDIYTTLSRRELQKLECEMEDSRKRESELMEKQEEFRSLSLTDPLTGVWNRRHLTEKAGKAIQHARESGSPLSLAIIDIDLFKEINDMDGHTTGDEVLKGLAGLLEEHSRPDDLIARYGGDEFLLLLVHCNPGNAVKLMNVITNDAREHLSPLRRAGQVTLSIGVAGLRELEDAESGLGELIDLADSRLYLSKSSGRDRVTGPS